MAYGIDIAACRRDIARLDGGHSMANVSSLAKRASRRGFRLSPLHHTWSNATRSCRYRHTWQLAPAGGHGKKKSLATHAVESVRREGFSKATGITGSRSALVHPSRQTGPQRAIV